MAKKKDGMIQVLEDIKKAGPLGINLKNLTNKYLDVKHLTALEYLDVLKFDTGISLLDLYGENDDEMVKLTPEGYFKLLEYQELDEARTSSKRAQLTAIAAIIIGIVVGTWQIFLTYFPPGQ